MTSMSRRTMGKLFLAASAGSLAAGRLTAETPNPLGEFLAAQDPGLSPPERERVKTSVASLESSLNTIRSFPLINAVGPAGRFRAQKSKER